LSPIDPDGDEWRCRWATEEESDGGFNTPGFWPSLSLDEENCIVTYTGSLDTTVTGVKPISLMLEDFDLTGNVRSSIPVQFLGQVWRPDLRRRSRARSKGNFLLIPLWANLFYHFIQ